MSTDTKPLRCLMVGYGWRSGVFLRLISQLPSLELAGVVVRRERVAGEAASVWHTSAYTALAPAIESSHPDFAVLCVPRSVVPDLAAVCAQHGLPVLAETPPAPDLLSLRAVWETVGPSGLVQVAEQYPFYPAHVARRAVVAKGVIGNVTGVEVSSTHGYHAIALIRSFLGGTFGPARVAARSFPSKLADPISRDAGWTGDLQPKDATTVIATVDFGGSMGLYDFTSNQWHNRLRRRRVVVRGERGEIVDDDVVWLSENQTIAEATLVRRQSGYDLDLEGFDTQRIFFNGGVVFENGLDGFRLADDEIAVGTLLVQMADWCRGSGPPPYPLAEACQDQLLALAVSEATATGKDVYVGEEKWALDHSPGVILTEVEAPCILGIMKEGQKSPEPVDDIGSQK